MRKKPEKRLQLRCPSCGGTGFPIVMQPTQPGRKIYPATCKQCEGKGWIKQPNEKAG
jgi:DnaJ-class molecular chaperone